MCKKLIIVVSLLIVCGLEASAQIEKRVKFAKGATSATVAGSINGENYIDYIVGIRAGQVLSLDLQSKAAQLVIFEPSGENMPDAAGISGGIMQIDETGDYKIRVLTTRASARRRKASAKFSLKIEVSEMVTPKN